MLQRTASRVVLTPRRWRQVCGGRVGPTGLRQTYPQVWWQTSPVHQESAKETVKNHCVRECRVIPVYSLLLVCVLPTTKCTRGRGCNGHPAFPTPSKGGRFINASGALRGEVADVRLMDKSRPNSQLSSPAKELVKDTDLILRSLRSKRLEGWTQRTDSRPSFETRQERAPQDEVGDIFHNLESGRSSIPRRPYEIAKPPRTRYPHSRGEAVARFVVRP